ncbi:MAG: hypothetical protein P4L93_07315 [Coriobacteriia bacterium]|nr:hypothetical protein [Coriobacteriia bacterium]
MRDWYPWGKQRNPDETEQRAAATVIINWVPTVLILGLYVWWSLITFILGNRVPDFADAGEAVSLALLGCAFLVVIPTLVRRFAPKTSRAGRATIVLVIWAVIAVPLSIGLFWSSYDALHPVPARFAGSLPDVAALIGRTPHDVERILGSYKVVGEAVLPPGEGPSPWRPGGANAQSVVIYSLPDLNTINYRPQKRASEAAESQQFALEFGSSTSPAQWNSDAVVLAYYGANSTIVGVRMEVSMRSAAEALSNVTSATVLEATGIERPVLVPNVVGYEPGTDPSKGETAFWGGGTAKSLPIGFELQIGGLSNFLIGRTAVEPSASGDLGDLTLVAAPGLNAAPSQLQAASGPPSTAVVQAAERLAVNPLPPVGKDSYSDATFWVILCSPPYSTEEQAIQRAQELNAGRVASAQRFTVERSGHLATIGTSDFWVVIYDIGYSQEQDARDAVASNGNALPQHDVKIAHITKICGDYTIAKIVR